MEPNETLADFIKRRRRELDQLEQELRDQLEEIAVERQQLSSAEKISVGLNTPESETIRAINKRERGIKPGTIMDEVMQILRRHENGLPSNEILYRINLKRDHNYLARESLSPQLSRLKQAGFIVFDGSNWKLSPDQPTTNRGGEKLMGTQADLRQLEKLSR